MKRLTSKEAYLLTMEKINDTLTEPDKLSKKQILDLYEHEIAPYGYPNHQKFMLYQAVQTRCFNENILNGKYKGYKMYLRFETPLKRDYTIKWHAP